MKIIHYCSILFIRVLSGLGLLLGEGRDVAHDGEERAELRRHRREGLREVQAQRDLDLRRLRSSRKCEKTLELLSTARNFSISIQFYQDYTGYSIDFRSNFRSSFRFTQTKKNNK